MLPYQSSATRAQTHVPSSKAFTQSQSNLFVKNLPFNIQEQALKEIFTKFGPVRSLKVKRPDINQRN